jgi:hypothetical protein
MNTDGGTLIIGGLEEDEFYSVLDRIDETFGPSPIIGNYRIVGIEHEYKRKGFDGFELSLHDALLHRVDPSSVAEDSTSMGRVRYGQRDLCVITVQESLTPIYAIEDSGANYRFLFDKATEL